MPRADELLDRARLAASSGNYPLATRYLDRASSSADNPYVLARAEITRAYLEAETGDPEGAMQRRLRVLRGELDPTTEGKAWQQLGLIRMRTGEADQAMDAFAQAIAVLPAGSEDLGYVRLNRGDVHLQHGRARQAAADFAAARADLDRPGLELEGG